jgi:RNA exonuclease 1
MLQLAVKRQKWERLVKELGGADEIKGEDRWLVEDDREMERRVAEAREGMGFFCVK